MTRHQYTIDVERDGLPVDDEIELLVESAGAVRGRIMLTAATRISRPDLERRLVAVTLAQQVGAALGAPAAGEGPGFHR